MNGTSDPKRPETPQVRLSDEEWTNLEKRHAAERAKHSRDDSKIQIRIEGDQHRYNAGEQIRLQPDQVGTAATVTGEDGLRIAAFLLPETDGDDVDLVHPGPPSLTLSKRGRTAMLHREITTADLSLLDIAHWIRCHWHVAFILAFTWMIIGVQVTLVEVVRGSFQSSAGQSSAGLINTSFDSALNAYLIGTILGALLFGWMADRIDRQRVYAIAAFVYIATAFATALILMAGDSGDDHRYALAAFRFLAGIGIGGEYVFLYTAVQEFMPKKRRGLACLAISGTFWLGFLVAALINAFCLNMDGAKPYSLLSLD